MNTQTTPRENERMPNMDKTNEEYLKVVDELNLLIANKEKLPTKVEFYDSFLDGLISRTRTNDILNSLKLFNYFISVVPKGSSWECDKNHEYNKYLFSIDSFFYNKLNISQVITLPFADLSMILNNNTVLAMILEHWDSLQTRAFTTDQIRKLLVVSVPLSKFVMQFVKVMNQREIDCMSNNIRTVLRFIENASFTFGVFRTICQIDDKVWKSLETLNTEQIDKILDFYSCIDRVGGIKNLPLNDLNAFFSPKKCPSKCTTKTTVAPSTIIPNENKCSTSNPPVKSTSVPIRAPYSMPNKVVTRKTESSDNSVTHKPTSSPPGKTPIVKKVIKNPTLVKKATRKPLISRRRVVARRVSPRPKRYQIKRGAINTPPRDNAPLSLGEREQKRFMETQYNPAVITATMTLLRLNEKIAKKTIHSMVRNTTNKNIIIAKQLIAKSQKLMTESLSLLNSLQGSE